MTQDKILHAAAGFLIASIAGALAWLSGWPAHHLWAALAAMVAGLTKEAWDSTGRGNVDGLDALATAAGGIIAAIIIALA